VRHLPTTATAWYSVNDDLTGTAASFGDPDDDSVEWNVKFDTLNFDKFLFTYGNFKYWGILKESTITACTGENVALEWEKTSLSQT
jgi:hypothetical protein